VPHELHTQNRVQTDIEVMNEMEWRKERFTCRIQGWTDSTLRKLHDKSFDWAIEGE
jgi:hypothetical protein